MGAALHQRMVRCGERVERSGGTAPPLYSAMNSRDIEAKNGTPLGIASRAAGQNACVIELLGELDLGTIPRLEGKLMRALQANDGVVLDLGRLSFID